MGGSLWFLNSPGPAPEAEDPSLGLTVCAIGLACIFIYFCCCCCSFFFFSRIRDFLIKKNFFITTICLGFPGSSVVKNPPAMQETWVQSLGWEDPLEKEMATHSSILAWRIPWTEGPGGLQSTGSQRVRHDLVTKPPPP